MQSRLPHQRKQSDGLQRNRLATRVGSRNDQQREIFSDPNVCRNDLPAVYQRMPSLLDIDISSVVKYGFGSLHQLGKLCSRKNEIQLSDRILVVLQLLGLAVKHVRKALEYLFDLVLFSYAEFTEFVV